MHNSHVPIREVGLIGLAAAALFAVLAIASYSPADPAFSFTAVGSGGHVNNLVGRSGAWFADVMLYLFGWVSYLLPFALLVVGVRLIRRRDEPLTWLLVTVRALGWLGVLLTSCILLALHVAAPSGLPAGVGGILGQWLTRAGLPVFGWVGLTLVTLTGLIIGVQAASGVSWLQLAEATGRARPCAHGHAGGVDGPPSRRLAASPGKPTHGPAAHGDTQGQARGNLPAPRRAQAARDSTSGRPDGGQAGAAAEAVQHAVTG